VRHVSVAIRDLQQHADEREFNGERLLEFGIAVAPPGNKESANPRRGPPRAQGEMSKLPLCAEPKIEFVPAILDLPMGSCDRRWCCKSRDKTG
jgi:hypothetical protein